MAPWHRLVRRSSNAVNRIVRSGPPTFALDRNVKCWHRLTALARGEGRSIYELFR